MHYSILLRCAQCTLIIDIRVNAFKLWFIENNLYA